MAGYLNDRVYDNGLTVLDTEANRLDITSQQATTYAEATSTYTLANKTSISIGAPAARGGGGREVEVAAITGGTVTGSGSGTHFAIVDTGNSRLLAAGPLQSSQTLSSGNTFSLPAFKIGIPAPA